MTLIVASVCADGILVSSDGLGIGQHTKTGEQQTLYDMQKSFVFAGRFVWGISGRRVEDPELLIRLFEALPHNLAVLRTAERMFERVVELHDPSSNPGTRLWFLLAGYDEAGSHIVTAKAYDSEVVFEEHVGYAAIGWPGQAEKTLAGKHLASVPSTRVQQKHNEVFARSARKYPAVGSLNNRWLVTPNGVKPL